jgi:hypothetical protein
VQPRSVVDGVSEAYGYTFAETDEWFESANNSGSVAAITVFFRAEKFTDPGGTLIVMEHTASIAGANDGFYILSVGGAPRVGIGRGGSSYLIHDYGAQSYTDSVYCARFDMSEATNTDRIKLYRDGVLLTPSGTPFSATVTGNFQSDKFYFGARSGGILPWPGRLRHLAIYTGAAGLSGADIAAISAALLAL